MKWAVVQIWNDGGQQAIPHHRILYARWNTPEQAIESMKYVREIMGGKYYVRNIEEGEP
jgi:hypothetical protein